ncbi:MAG: LLM class flavin-dependent oxidoreductase [Hyphomonadaceae bacterium]|nr:LLM class flavin-dependent oxidoreductase [Hyphomonadaceae bacterium]
MIKPWVFEFVETHEAADPLAFNGARAQEIIAWKGDLWPDLERRGFEGVFFSEHHFRPNGLCSSPNLFVAWLAARTTRLRLGVMGSVTPMHHPWRLAEEYSLLDQLSGGRMEFGFSSGIAVEAERVGVPRAELRARFEEALEIFQKATRQDAFSHEGRFWSFKDLRIVPRPLQADPPCWITATSASSAQFAARKGYKLCTGFLPTEGVASLFDSYRNAASEAGRKASPDDLGLRRLVFIADTDAAAERIGAAAATAMADRIRRSNERLAAQRANQTTGHVPDAPASPRLNIHPDEQIFGSPSTVAAKITEQCRRVGAGHFLAYTIDTLTQEETTRSFELWRDVAPELRRA